jgi:hypothetical protein
MQVEIGDMIHWDTSSDPDGYDVGWVIHVENRALPSGSKRVIYIRWLFEGDVDTLWQGTILNNEYIKVTKGGQYD